MRDLKTSSGSSFELRSFKFSIRRGGLKAIRRRPSGLHTDTLGLSIQYPSFHHRSLMAVMAVAPDSRF